MRGNIVRNIIVPEKMGLHYIIPTRVIGLDIGTHAIIATKVMLQGKTTTVEKIVIEPLEQNADTPQEQKVTESLKKVMAKMGSYDYVRSSLSSANALFKELTLPFVDHDKIKSVLPYEIEQFLPFAVSELIIDFIITSIDVQHNTATIFVAALKKEYIAAHLALLQSAGIDPDAITIDLFDLYALYMLIPAYKEFISCALIDVGLYTIRIVYTAHTMLRGVRIIPKGIMHYAQTSDVTPEEVLKNLPSTASFFEDIVFTLAAFEKKFNAGNKTDKILTLGLSTDAQSTEYIAQATSSSCSSFNLNELLHNAAIKNKTADALPQQATYSLACALSSPITQYTNMRQDEFKQTSESLFLKQIITTGTLLLLIIGALIIHIVLQRRQLTYALHTMQQQIVTSLYDHGLTKKRSAEQVSEAMSEAEEKVEVEKEIWFAFSSQARFSFLKYLYALSAAIDKKSTGLDLKRLEITYNKIVLDGEVPDFPQLAILDKELAESPAFNFKTNIQTLKFSNVEITIRNNDEAAL